MSFRLTNRVVVAIVIVFIAAMDWGGSLGALNTVYAGPSVAKTKRDRAKLGKPQRKRKATPAPHLDVPKSALDQTNLGTLASGPSVTRFFHWKPGLSPNFSSLLSTAEVINSIEDVAWSVVHSCEPGESLEQRQCRAVRAARVKSWTHKTILVKPEPGAFEFSAWDPKAKSIVWTIGGCLQCRGLLVDGVSYQVFAGPPPLVGQTTVPTKPVPFNVVGDTRVFRDSASAANWLRRAARAEVDLLVITNNDVWRVGSWQGLAFEVVGYRIWDRCDGYVLAASDTADSTDPVADRVIDKAACR